VSPEPKREETGLYSSPAEALKKLGTEYDYWSGKLTETSLQMCYALIAANWIVFGSMNGILSNFWAKASLLMVLLALATNIVGAWKLSEAIRERVKYGEADKLRWATEFKKYVGADSPWPFTNRIDGIGRWMRGVKAIFTIASGVFLVIGAIIK
jgi:hypothetical protein